MTLKLITAVLFDTALISVCLYAFARGGFPERFGAAIMLAGTILPVILRIVMHSHWTHFEASAFVIDVIAAGAFAWLALPPFDRFWPTWALGFMLADLAVHIARAPLTRISAIAYETTEAMFAYGLLVALLIGSISASRARRERTRSATAPNR